MKTRLQSQGQSKSFLCHINNRWMQKQYKFEITAWFNIYCIRRFKNKKKESNGKLKSKAKYLSRSKQQTMSFDSSHMHLCEKKLFARIIYKFNIHLCKVLLAFTPNEQSTMVTRFTKWHMDFSRILFASRKQSNTNYHKEIDHINRSIIIALPITMVNKIYRETVIMANCMQYP